MAENVRYGIGSWPEKGHGNHRALIRVSEKEDAVWAHVEWRRRDPQPETKGILVFDAATGQRITNVVAISVTREFGDIAFQPATAPGEYEVYYLPYNPGTSNFDDAGTYFPPEVTADPNWLEANRLDALGLESGAWQSLPQAELVEIQARTEFNRMDPMEVVATEAEVAQLLAAHPSQSYILFPEDRRYPIRMPDDVPYRWIERGPSGRFVGRAQPGEYYVFQIGVYAARTPIRDVRLTLGELGTSEGRTIPGSALTCFNLGGTDWLGRPMTKIFEVGEGQVRPLWIGVPVPEDASGTYRGTMDLCPVGAEPTPVDVSIRVTGPVLQDAGDSGLQRLSRLRWLNSTLGLDDEVIPPFTPLQVESSTVKCLDRAVRFDALGLPESIVSRGNEVLAAPMAFVVETAAGPLRWQAIGTTLPKAEAGIVERETHAQGDGVDLTLRSKMEADGCVAFAARLKAKKRLDLRDVRLEVPIRREIATYMMGMSRRGGTRLPQWDWKWDITRSDHMVWLGEVNAGLQLKLMGPKDVWQNVNLEDTGIPPSWGNDGKGGCTIREEGQTVLVRAFSGQRALQAGEELEFRFRLLVTPFKPIDKRHWNWRYGDVNGDANILHLHHAARENPYINYPFLTADRIAALVKSVKAISGNHTDHGSLTYPAEGNINLARGALHVWATVNFDPKAGEPLQSRYNQPLFFLQFPNQDELGFYWNVDVRGMRAYVRKGAPERNQFSAMLDASAPEWQKGQRHLLTLSWGDKLAICIDGKLRAQSDYRGIIGTPLAGATLRLCGGFDLDAVKITDVPFQEGTPVTPSADDHTLFLDTFSSLDGTKATHPERIAGNGRGTFSGMIELLPGEQGQTVRFSSRLRPSPPKGVNIYYTVRELSNHVVEMWPLRSLGNEVFVTGDHDIYSLDKAARSTEDGGYPWLREHLVSGYAPAWRQPLFDGDMDAAIATQGLSRWHNYYVEGLKWLMEDTGVDGLYLDGIGYDREIMKRVAKVMQRTNPDSRINFHCGNDFDYADRRISPLNEYMEHLPYISNLWIGEMYDYNRAPDYWLVEISGIPFGLTSEMLEYSNGGNPYRGMIYGMTGRLHPSAPAMWGFWDDFGIQDAEMIGYWDPKCPVRTDNREVLATVYRKQGKSLIALAHWPGEKPGSGPVEVRLGIDWQSLGLDPARARLTAPAIESFQPAAQFTPDDAIPVEPGKGWLLVLQEQEVQ